jgi:hypothetical protein
MSLNDSEQTVGLCSVTPPGAVAGKQERRVQELAAFEDKFHKTHLEVPNGSQKIMSAPSRLSFHDFNSTSFGRLDQDAFRIDCG